jgi:hypothetical protein
LAYRDVWGEHDVVFDNGIGESLSPWTVSADFRRVVHELGLPKGDSARKSYGYDRLGTSLCPRRDQYGATRLEPGVENNEEGR